MGSSALYLLPKQRHSETGDVSLNPVSALYLLRDFAGVSEPVTSSITGVKTANPPPTACDTVCNKAYPSAWNVGDSLIPH